MRTLMVSYDLRKPGQNYERLIDYIKGLGSWWHCLESLWFVRSSMSAAQLRDALKTLVDSTDDVLVVDMSSNSWATYGLAGNCNSWLKENL